MSKTLIDDTSDEQKPNDLGSTDNGIKSANDLDSFLSGYKEQLNIVSEETEDKQPESFDANDPKNDPNNPMYFYTRGKKKGQRREKPYISKKQQKKAEMSTVGGEVISGLLFITVIDMLLPMIIALINNQFSDKKIDSNKLRLTAKQKTDLTPLCDDVIKQYNITADPLMMLIFSMVGIYGMNFLSVKQLLDE